MMNTSGKEALLSPYRVLDLTDEKGLLCGKILGDMGADVIKVEKPCGDYARRIGPFYHDEPDPEKSLHWFAYNANKKGITLDIEKHDGREIFTRLVGKAHFVIESFAPGYLQKLGLDYGHLSKVNPGLIMVSITPFGQAGPYSGFAATDIVAMAMGGHLYMTGDPDRAPVRCRSGQAYVNAGVDAAIGALVANHHRQLTGEGQHVDVSIQESVAGITLDEQVWWNLNEIIVKRAGSVRVRPDNGVRHRFIWPCKDGYLVFVMIGGSWGAGSLRSLVKWMDEEKMANDLVRNMDWDKFDWGRLLQDEVDAVMDPIGKFFMSHTKTELFEGAIQRRVTLYPVSTTEDTMKSVQLEARDYWTKLDHPELNTSITYPGPFIKASETPLTLRCRAPLLGEHNKEIYQRDLGLSDEDLRTLKGNGTI
jgi:crotonobetainyl-CoA:carnitine CoA-transferase CaiB-like acyl-CoA transferase